MLKREELNEIALKVAAEVKLSMCVTIGGTLHTPSTGDFCKEFANDLLCEVQKRLEVIGLDFTPPNQKFGISITTLPLIEE